MSNLPQNPTDIPNVLLVIPSTHQDDDGEAFDLVTSSFTGRFNSTLPMVLDHFGGTTPNFTRNANLFPNKLRNLQQRHLRLALFNYKPYSTVQHVVSFSRQILKGDRKIVYQKILNN